MSLYTKVCFVILGYSFSSIIVLNTCACKKLEGYKFPVYSTEFCPGNESEWNKRSSALNCNKTNGYTCLPNGKLTELLEFCHTAPFIWIQEGVCLSLKGKGSNLRAHSCSHFTDGCHNTSYQSKRIFDYPTCITIGNGCFLADQSCKSSSNETSGIDKDDLVWVLIVTGIVVVVCFLSFMLYVYRKRRYHICRRKSDLESLGEVEHIPLLLSTDLNKIPMGTNKEESPVDRAIFKQWQEDNSTFVLTRACKEVEKLIKSQSLVVVTGNSGSGKSAIIQHIALSYRGQGWTVKPIYKVNEITKAYSSLDKFQNKTLFVLNDPIGNELFDEIAYNLWKVQEERTKCFLKWIKILVSCRKYILNDPRVNGILKDKSSIVDLSHGKLKLDNDEKQKIWRSHSSTSILSKDEINVIAQTDEYFPLLCKLYLGKKIEQKDKLRFFEEPVAEMEKEIRNFRLSQKGNYCALVLLVLFNNKLCIQDIWTSELSSKRFKLALKLCEMSRETTPPTIGDRLESLQGYFIKKIGDTYQFYHNLVMKVTTYVFGTDYPGEMIKYADIGVLRRRVKLENNHDKNDQFVIFLSEEKFAKHLGERLFNDIFGERFLDAILNPCMRNEEVATFFITKLNDCPDKLSLLNEKIKLPKKKQQIYQSRKRSTFSKLGFVCLKDEVSIINAIIVFCHKKLSKHCLETLLQMQTFIKDNYLFSAVCCNGSIDLFHLFSKEQIEELLMENWESFYPIHIASMFHNHEILLELIGVKNDVNLISQEEKGYTPIMLAAFGTEESEQTITESKIQSINITVDLLQTNGANINSCHPKSGNPLHIASAGGNNYIVNILLDKGANINSCDNYNKTPLHIASEFGHESTVQLLLHRGANINSGDKYRETPLHKASINGHNSTVQLLLDEEANINSCDLYGTTPLHKACENKQWFTVRLLLDKGANINLGDQKGETPLYKSSKKGLHSIVQILLRNGADIDLGDMFIRTPLHEASINGHISTVQLLLDEGANINSCDVYQKTPLCMACENDQSSIVQLLLKYKAYISSCDIYRETPIHKACEFGTNSTVQLLLANGADINICDEDGETPLHKACENGQDCTVPLILDNGADINSCDINGETPLHKAACETGKKSIVQLLLNYGANVNSCDKKQRNSSP